MAYRKKTAVLAFRADAEFAARFRQTAKRRRFPTYSDALRHLARRWVEGRPLRD